MMNVSSLRTDSSVGRDAEIANPPDLYFASGTLKPKKGYRTNWWKRPCVLYSLAAVIILFSVGSIAVVVTLFFMPQNDSNAAMPGSVGTDIGEPFGDATADVNLTLAPSPSPSPAPPRSTSAPTARAAIALPTVSPTQKPTLPIRTAPLSFYVMGDTPYRESEQVLLEEQIDFMTNNLRLGATFTVHVGDMMKASRTMCGQYYYENVRATLAKGPLPTFVHSGDNDFLDCPDPSLAWSHYQSAFANTASPFEHEWNSRLPMGVPPLNVTRWTQPENVPVAGNTTRMSTCPEMFSFFDDGILFMSLTILNDSENEDYLSPAWYARLEDSKHWASKQVQAAKAQHGANIRGIVIFGHSLLSSALRPFFMEVKAIFESNMYFGPTLYIHGDGHLFEIEDNYQDEWSSFTGIQVDRGGKADPLLITVAPAGTNALASTAKSLVAENANQFVIANGLFLVDRQQGRYPDE